MLKTLSRYLISIGPLRIIAHKKIKNVKVGDDATWEEVEGFWEVISCNERLGEDHTEESQLINLTLRNSNTIVLSDSTRARIERIN